MANPVPHFVSGALFQHIPELGYFAKDPEGRFLAANPAFAEMAGVADPGALIGKTDHAIWPRFLADLYRKDDAHVVRSGTAMVNKIELIIRPDRSTDWFATTKVPVAGPGGEPAGIEGVCRHLKKAKTPVGDTLRMPAVIAYIMEHYAERIEIPELARMASLSVKQFERNFSRQYGEVPVRYIQRIRLDAARQLLAMTDLPIAQVSRETGFYDSSHLSNHFRAYAGDTPLAFRRKHRGGA